MAEEQKPKFFRIVVDPVTGRSHTEESADPAVAQAQLAEARRSTRGFLRGDVPFHEDEFAAPAQEKTEEPDITTAALYREGEYYALLANLLLDSLKQLQMVRERRENAERFFKCKFFDYQAPSDFYDILIESGRYGV